MKSYEKGRLPQIIWGSKSADRVDNAFYPVTKALVWLESVDGIEYKKNVEIVVK